jgi:aminoglycoside phosphotransferase (APT) family kinase protein
LCDLGTLLGLWSNSGERLAGSNPMPTQTPGFITRQQAAVRYAERSGRDVSKLAYYIVFGTFKMGVVLQQIYFRFHRGQTQDQRFAGMGKLAEGLFQLAADRRT